MTSCEEAFREAKLNLQVHHLLAIYTTLTPRSLKIAYLEFPPLILAL